MGLFTLPEELPTGIEDLDALHTEAKQAFQELKATAESRDLSDEEIEQLQTVVEAIKTVESAQQAAADEIRAKQDQVSGLISEVDSDDESSDEPGDEESADEDDESEESVDVIDTDGSVVSEAEQVVRESAPVVASGRKKGTVARKTTKFAGSQRGRAPAVPPKREDVGFRMEPGIIGYQPGRVGFREIAEAIDQVKPGARARSNRPGPARGGTRFASAQTLARLDRDLPLIEDSHALVQEIERATDPANMRAPQFNAEGALTAAGGWCAPSETLYDFCEVPTATDLISVPELTVRRGGVRWPIEPDLSAIFDSFEFFFCEPELEADPPPVKECVEIPCPEEFEELRLCVVGYCVEAGILQAQGWPELIEWFMRSLTQEHLRAMSRRTINDMVAGSTAITIPDTSQIAAGSSILNSLELMAVNLRLDKGLSRTALIEGVAPVWLHPLVRADLANQQGVDTKNVTDAQINGWLSARNIALQFVGDWQTRGPGQPGNLETTEYPSTVQVLLYPAGTWFRALSNVIEFGVMYPKEQLQINRYTQFFTEDAIAVGKRCNQSLVVTIPVCPNGAYGQQDSITCEAPADEVQDVAITGTAPTGGDFTLTFKGETTAPIAWNAANTDAQTALEALTTIGTGNVAVTGGPLPGAALTVTFQGDLAGTDQPTMSANGSGLTGGDTTTEVTVTVVTNGGT